MDEELMLKMLEALLDAHQTIRALRAGLELAEGQQDEADKAREDIFREVEADCLSPGLLKLFSPHPSQC